MTGRLFHKDERSCVIIISEHWVIFWTSPKEISLSCGWGNKDRSKQRKDFSNAMLLQYALVLYILFFQYSHLIFHPLTSALKDDTCLVMSLAFWHPYISHWNKQIFARQRTAQRNQGRLNWAHHNLPSLNPYFLFLTDLTCEWLSVCGKNWRVLIIYTAQVILNQTLFHQASRFTSNINLEFFIVSHNYYYQKSIPASALLLIHTTHLGSVVLSV